jgi:hypothetical protein
MKSVPSLLTDGVRAEFPLRLIFSPGSDQVIDRSTISLSVHFNNSTNASVSEFGDYMTACQRHLPTISAKLFLVLGVILTWEVPSAFSASNPCEEFVPTNFKTLSLEKKVQVSEVIRECERKLAQKSKDSKGAGPPQRDTRTLAYMNAGPNR